MIKRITNELLLEKLNSLEKLHSAHREHTETQLSNILQQTTKTNGRVGEVENQVSKLNSWKDRAGGIWFAVLIFASSIGVVGGIIATVYAAKTEQNVQANRDKIEKLQKDINKNP